MTKKISAIKVLQKKYSHYDNERLKAFFVCKNVIIGNELVTDPQMKVCEELDVQLVFPKFVSRGGFKLEHALKEFKLDVKGLVMLDAGSSTGGFTDCLLQHGASKVHSVDVGYNQLSYSLRSNSKVVVHERQNIMGVETLKPEADAGTADLSFRSIKGAAGHILGLCKEDWMVALIKPQFEVSRWQLDFNGVIEDEKLMLQILSQVWDNLKNENVNILNLVCSPIKGRKGNTEFLALLSHSQGIKKEEMLEKAILH
ncbi:MAG: TlyA family RNA methyltransferase [Sphaerochaetaceae bacterium]